MDIDVKELEENETKVEETKQKQRPVTAPLLSNRSKDGTQAKKEEKKKRPKTAPIQNSAIVSLNKLNLAPNSRSHSEFF